MPGCFTSPVKEPYPQQLLRKKERNGISASYSLHHFFSKGLQQQLLRNQSFRQLNYIRKESHRCKHDSTEFSAPRHPLCTFCKRKSCQHWHLSQNTPAPSKDFKAIPAQLWKLSYSLIKKQGKEESKKGKLFSKSTCTQITS